ncbi:LOG family protein [Ureibacillus manganicus]|uniref:Cytokinin riboside 5'-monophosphate phosphoribohydrolase n=1 Tax=Ureibacillus manganicus DSM 26584 TaxID=1384049 RepID=A0A0A3HVI5_9BACL|nr:TIGR00730 family Rossman fold protein [Ureibacillus manganicus]KGR75240.1 decarboxylase [Ureibacillus manganicus DSM 26584]
MNVAIYCGSQTGKNPIYIEKAKELGEQLAKAGLGIVYGGSTVGLMGAVADSALAHKGRVIGIMPEHLQKRELTHLNLTEIHIVDSMHSRKAKMADLADSYIALPGGCGTLDEYFEIFTWAQIGLHAKPVILYNINGFYGALIQHFEKMLDEGFIREEQRSILQVASSVDEIIKILLADEGDLGKVAN